MTHSGVRPKQGDEVTTRVLLPGNEPLLRGKILRFNNQTGDAIVEWYPSGYVTPCSPESIIGWWDRPGAPDVERAQEES